MNDEQTLALQRLMVGLDARYGQMNAKLSDAIAQLERSRTALDAADPLRNELAEALHMLIRAEQDGTTLQSEVAYTLRHQLMQARSAKAAYEQGWAARAIDILAQATPTQVALLYALLTDLSGDEDGLPF